MRFNKQTGPRPSKTVLDVASTLARRSTKDYMAVAMTMRPNGATQNEIIAALGRPHRNKIRQLLADKRVSVHVLPEGTRATRIKLVKR